MFLILLLASLALQVWAWQSLRRRVASRAITRLGAMVRYGGWALAPVALCIAVLFGLIGLEEASSAAIIPEEVGRAALPAAAVLLGIAIVGWISFAIGCVLVRRGTVT